MPQNKPENVNLEWKKLREIVIVSFYDLIVKKSAMERTYWDYNQLKQKLYFLR
jgi:hypothetical protein